MIGVHHLENSRSQRVLWLLEELELDYEIVGYRRDPQTMLAPDSLKQVHPLGKSPVLVDDQVSVAESGAIIDYLIEAYDHQRRLVPPAGSAEYRHYRYWLHYAEGSAMPLLVMSLVFTRLGKPPVPALMRPFGRALANGVKAKYLEPQMRRHLDFWESQLAASRWFAGEQFTAADIQMSFPLLAREARGGLGERPNLLACLARMRERPAYQRAIEKGGEFSM
ncbi:MAG: glutathione S-transferase [Pseudomonadota bacterium]|uniref:glutathione S-transferase n=1 Tax=Halomonas sp. IOP_31 TaxID=2876584 RepID=UPI001E5BA1E4|nr:glutathione S-transferase [Halomonas sp. IOP_31]MCD6007723.1 glutathione S-transferase [Halomonas sp. IOP_31]MEA3250204.1 glutathione S-transferase [Pseudomonadota bacterium]